MIFFMAFMPLLFCRGSFIPFRDMGTWVMSWHADTISEINIERYD